MSHNPFNLPPSAISSESSRIRSVFGQRNEIGDGPFDLYRLLTHLERQEILVRFFRTLGFESLHGMKILDVGCGSGGQLRRLVDFGAEPCRCFGVDLDHNGLVRGRDLNPTTSFIEGSAAQLPFADGEFDLVFQFTVLTSVLDATLKRSIASEIHRVLRPGGCFVWYDFVYSNPKNPNVRGISRREISELLRGFQLNFQRATLAPPIGRRAVRISPLLYRALNCIPLLRSHYFCFATKPGPDGISQSMREHCSPGQGTA
jgi:ubiquinone/menaquinone biosynthesis C-methylase UbiE